MNRCKALRFSGIMRTCSAVLLSISLVRAASATDAQSRITHEGYEKDMKHFWDHADARFSHIEYNGHLKSEAHLRATWEKEWLGHFPVLDRYSVMEYGIGGGLLGEHLLTTRGASHYVGIDISTRQLEHAAERSPPANGAARASRSQSRKCAACASSDARFRARRCTQVVAAGRRRRS